MKARRPPGPAPGSDAVTLWRRSTEMERQLERELVAERIAHDQTRADLVRFGQHDTSCAFVAGARPCTCGLVAAVNRRCR